VVLFNVAKDEKTGEEYIEFRHYGISARQRDVHKSIKRLVNSKKAPNLSRLNDLSDFLLNK
jgi:hypothetical protein